MRTSDGCAKLEITSEGYISERVQEKIHSAFFSWHFVFSSYLPKQQPQYLKKQSLVHLQILELKMKLIDVSWHLTLDVKSTSKD